MSRLTSADWTKLRAESAAKGVCVVALDLPTSYMLADAESFTARMSEAINGMLLDMLAAVAGRRKVRPERRPKANTRVGPSM
ncbi:hypothetical protein [Rhodovibrio salinarum]|uniref:hypothetical protein n=1 Tax=Rhodovibrio salinarum TaxID=1087 RepID=UPI003F589C74